MRFCLSAGVGRKAHATVVISTRWRYRVHQRLLFRRQAIEQRVGLIESTPIAGQILRVPAGGVNQAHAGSDVPFVFGQKCQCGIGQSGRHTHWCAAVSDARRRSRSASMSAAGRWVIECSLYPLAANRRDRWPHQGGRWPPSAATGRYPSNRRRARPLRSARHRFPALVGTA